MFLQTGLCTGVSLAVALGLFFPSMSKLFTADAQVLDIIKSLVMVRVSLIHLRCFLHSLVYNTNLYLNSSSVPVNLLAL